MAIQITTTYKDTDTNIRNTYHNQCSIIEAAQAIRRKQYHERTVQRKEFYDMQKKVFGNFIFFIYQNIDSLLKILTDADFVKFLYMGTYIHSNRYLMHDNRTYMNKSDLFRLLGVSRQTFNKFYNKLKDTNLLIEDDNKIMLSLEYFCKGYKEGYKLANGKNISMYTRIYINTIRDAYTSVKPNAKSHKWIAYVYRLIPYVNWRYNIICKNPSEPNKSDIEPYDIKGIMELLHYSVNKQHIQQFKDNILGFKFNGRCVFFGVDIMSNKQQKVLYNICVDPRFYYKGSNIDDVKWIIDTMDFFNKSN